MNPKLDLMLLLLCLFVPFLIYLFFPSASKAWLCLDHTPDTATGAGHTETFRTLTVTVQLTAFRIRSFFILCFKDESLQKISKEQTISKRKHSSSRVFSQVISGMSELRIFAAAKQSCLWLFLVSQWQKLLSHRGHSLISFLYNVYSLRVYQMAL